MKIIINKIKYAAEIPATFALSIKIIERCRKSRETRNPFQLKVMKELSHSMKNINQMLIGVFLQFQLWIPTTKSSIQNINQPKVKKEEEESDIFQKPKISFSLLQIFQTSHRILINIKKFIANRILKINLRMWNFNKIISI